MLPQGQHQQEQPEEHHHRRLPQARDKLQVIRPLVDHHRQEDHLPKDLLHLEEDHQAQPEEHHLPHPQEDMDNHLKSYNLHPTRP